MVERGIAIVSLLAGVATFTAGATFHDFTAALSGLGAATMAVVLYRQADFAARLTRLENILMKDNRATAHKHGG